MGEVKKTAKVPFFRPSVGREEEEELLAALRSGWLTTGPRAKRFEEEFATAVGGKRAVAVNSATAALHLAVEALGLKAGQGVLVPTMTSAATAEVVRYLGAVPVLVDCDPVSGNLDLDDASRKLEALRAGRLSPKLPRDARVVGIIPVHVGGLMLDMDLREASEPSPCQALRPALRRALACHVLWGGGASFDRAARRPPYSLRRWGSRSADSLDSPLFSHVFRVRGA